MASTAQKSEKSTISREEYLKRYLNPDDDKKKVKKKKPRQPVKKSIGLKIIDSNIDVRVENEDFDDEVGEDAPLVAGVIDERPIEAQFGTRKKYSQWEIDDASNAKKYMLDSPESQKTRGDRSRAQNNSDSDFSPQREQPADSRRRYDSSDSDNSREPRTALPLYDDHEASPKKSSTSKKLHDSRVKSDSDGDISPPRLRNNSDCKNVDSDGDLSPPRQNNHQKSAVDSDGDLSPPRSSNSLNNERRRDFGSDLSKSGDSSLQKRDKSVTSRSSSKSTLVETMLPVLKERVENDHRPDKTLSGLKAGLQSASLLRKESKHFREKQKRHIQEMSDEVSGRNAEVIHRNRATGEKRDLAAEQQKKEEENKKKAEREAKYAKWGKGIEQTEEQSKKLQQDFYEMTKPLARYGDDDDLDSILKEQDRAGDPMLEYMTKKKKKNTQGTTFPEYQGAAPINRFGIRPGYRWDGVDRSNGFEKRYFEKINDTKSKEHEAHLWSIQDM